MREMEGRYRDICLNWASIAALFEGSYINRKLK